MIGGKCLSIGSLINTKNKDAHHAILTDCDSAVSWTEGFTSKESSCKYGHPQISASQQGTSFGKICLAVGSDGVTVDKCEDDRSGSERVNLRNFWNPAYSAIMGPFRNPDFCLDAEGDKLVKKLCSQASKWKRVGPPGPEPPLPKPMQPATLVGNYSLFWPLAGGVTGIDETGYPHYYGNNQAEACPLHRRVPGTSQCHWPEKSTVPMYQYKHGVPMQANVMTRSMILQRALVWVANNFAGQDNLDKAHNAVGVEGCAEGESREACPRWFHGGACCSLPANAWNISYCVKKPGSMGERINCDDLRPGDALSFGGHHVALFAGWVNPHSKRWMYIYERKGPARLSQRGRNMKTTTCSRRKHLIEDVEPENIPLALPFQAGDDEEAEFLDNPEPEEYNGECDDLHPVDYKCQENRAAQAVLV